MFADETGPTVHRSNFARPLHAKTFSRARRPSVPHARALRPVRRRGLAVGGVSLSAFSFAFLSFAYAIAAAVQDAINTTDTRRRPRRN